MSERVAAAFAPVSIEIHRGARRLAVAGLSSRGLDRPPDVIWLHANGFNARTYVNTLGPLTDKLSILAIDQRGHGGTPQNMPASGRTDALDMRDDLLALLDDVAPDASVILAGHSMGGCVSLLAAAVSPHRVKALALFDPVVLSREAAQRAMGAADAALAHTGLAAKARERRARFASRQEAFEAYRRRPFFLAWPQAALLDYIQDGFRDLPDGTVELSCAPEWEAANFAAHGHDIWAAMAAVEAPVSIWRAETGSTCAVTCDADFPRPPGQARVITVPGSSHCLPIEAPEVVREGLLGIAEGVPPRSLP